ncbi:alpha/beta fold hydrolase [Streptomyces sp. V4-01]|uniref:Alpha/beta fold hydrolase n=1 Tax=Actinacidiphila polyblastidii TaxID=3110430 RepID=A0ABU7PDL1_9ACTN|nr:alpha/beta fold hydrolase [Streptomyces sp. V4-01]
MRVLRRAPDAKDSQSSAGHHAPGAAGRRAPARRVRARRPLAAGVAAAVLAAGAVACAAEPSGSAGPPEGPGLIAVPAVVVTGHAYQVPRPLPAAAPGTLIAATDLGPDHRFADARRWTVLYHSLDAHGADVPVSGTVLVPAGPAPSGGRPVVSWGHGTTGVADMCAPSQSPNLGFDVYAQQLTALLRAGYAVTASDYPGLGTPGTHTYLVGADEGNAVVDIVTAARRLVPGLSTTWFAMGHSQGGQAALFAARAARRAPGLRLAGAVAMAPASHLEEMLPGVAASHVSSDLSFALYSLAGLAATDPSVRLPALLGPSAYRIAERVLAVCQQAGYTALDGVSTDEELPLTGEAADRLGAEMGAYGDPDRAAIRQPVLVVQGEDDQDVPVDWTAEVTRRLEALGSPAVEERTYPGAGHDEVLAASVCDVLAFLAEHSGRTAADCAPLRPEAG